MMLNHQKTVQLDMQQSCKYVILRIMVRKIVSVTVVTVTKFRPLNVKQSCRQQTRYQKNSNNTRKTVN